jgi:predicted phosphate transport protein (TIGR00153 family)
VAWIDKLVSRSPIKPMQQHMNVAVLCAREILPLLDAMAAGDLDAIRDRRAEIDRLEHEADEIKHEIRAHTPKRFMMALDRRTILEILDYQDSIADITQDIAELADQRNMHLLR